MDKTIIEKIEQEIQKIKDKKFKVSFFVFDTKGSPNGSLAYIYETACALTEKAYDVQMLHVEKEFVGVESWLGAKYSSLPHYNIEKDNVTVSPSDILIIPEICTSALSQTKGLPCKRILLVQNFSYLTEMIPMGVNLSDLKIIDCVTTSDRLAERIKNYFPYVRTKVVRPSIPEYFFEESKEPKKLLINVIAKNSTDINSIVKPFYWKYPAYEWVAFRDIKNLPREDFAKTLKEGAITIWVDTLTDFGYSALEAMACKNIVIGKVPENAPEWLEGKDFEIKNNGIWFYNYDAAPDLIAGAIQSFLTNSIPESVFEEMDKTSKLYDSDGQKNDIEEVYVKGIFEDRIKELQIALSVEQNNEKEN